MLEYETSFPSTEMGCWRLRGFLQGQRYEERCKWSWKDIAASFDRESSRVQESEHLEKKKKKTHPPPNTVECQTGRIV